MAGIDSGALVKHERPGIGEVVAAAAARTDRHPCAASPRTRAKALHTVRAALPGGFAGEAHASNEGSPCRRAARAAWLIDLHYFLHITTTAKRRARETT